MAMKSKTKQIRDKKIVGVIERMNELKERE
jgi:hypothetical protein